MSADPPRWIVIPRWDDFQHYKDRDPKWIKNYTRLVNDDAYLDLPLLHRGVLHGIWLLYARHERGLSEARARQVLVTSAAEARRWRDTMTSLSDAGFIHLVASNPLAKPYQSASPEEETETEVLGSSSASDPKAVTELDQAAATDLEHAPELNGTALEHEHIGDMIDAALRGVLP